MCCNNEICAVLMRGKALPLVPHSPPRRSDHYALRSPPVRLLSSYPFSDSLAGAASPPYSLLPVPLPAPLRLASCSTFPFLVHVPHHPVPASTLDPLPIFQFKRCVVNA